MNNPASTIGVGVLWTRIACLCVPLVAMQTAFAQVNVPIYTDQLINGFQNWGFATLNYANAAPVHSGTSSISITATGPWQGIQVFHSDIDASLFSSLSLWINGGVGGQQLQMFGMRDTTNQNAWQRPGYTLPILGTNTWQQLTISLSALQVANASNFTGFVI